MVDVAHDGDHRGAWPQVGLVLLLVVVVEELGQQLGLALLAGVDQAHLGAQLGGEQVDHVVGQGLGGRDHLPLEQQETDDVARRAVELGAQVAGGGAALDDDLGVGHRGRRRGVGGELGRLELLEVATTATGPALVGTATSDSRATPASGATGPTGTAAGPTTGAAAGTAAVATSGSTAGTTAEAAATAGAAATGGPTGPTAGRARAAGATGEPSGSTRTRPTRGRTASAGSRRRRDGLAGHRPRRTAGGRRDRTPGRAGRGVDRGRGRSGGRGARRRRAPGPGDAAARGLGAAAGAAAAGATGAGGGCGGAGAGAGAAGAGRTAPGRPAATGAGARAGAVGAGPAGRAGAGRRLLGGRAAGDQSGPGALDRRGGRGPGRRGRGLVADRRDRIRAARRGRVGRRRGLGRDLLRRGLLGGGGLLGRRCRLLGLHGAAEALTVGLAAGAVGLRVLDGRRVALDAHPEGQAEVERLFVGQAELVGELVDPDLLRQRLLLPFLHVVDADTHIRPSILAHHRTGLSEPGPAISSGPGPERGPDLVHLAAVDPTAQRPFERLPALRPVDAARASPGTTRPRGPRVLRATARVPPSSRTTRTSPSDRAGPTAPDAGPNRRYA